MPDSDIGGITGERDILEREGRGREKKGWMLKMDKWRDGGGGEGRKYPRGGIVPDVKGRN